VPISAIGQLCGFKDQAHLTTAFGRIMGTTPGRYRRSLDN
jgi:AraC family transcriptional regulator